jgi:hypothetical protein
MLFLRLVLFHNLPIFANGLWIGWWPHRYDVRGNWGCTIPYRWCLLGPSYSTSSRRLILSFAVRRRVFPNFLILLKPWSQPIYLTDFDLNILFWLFFEVETVYRDGGRLLSESKIFDIWHLLNNSDVQISNKIKTVPTFLISLLPSIIPKITVNIRTSLKFDLGFAPNLNLLERILKNWFRTEVELYLLGRFQSDWQGGNKYLWFICFRHRCLYGFWYRLWNSFCDWFSSVTFRRNSKYALVSFIWIFLKGLLLSIKRRAHIGGQILKIKSIWNGLTNYLRNIVACLLRVWA